MDVCQSLDYPMDGSRQILVSIRPDTISPEHQAGDSASLRTSRAHQASNNADAGQQRLRDAGQILAPANDIQQTRGLVPMLCFC